MNEMELKDYEQELLQFWKPHKHRPFSEVCEEHFSLSSGKFRARPAQKAVLDAMTDPLIEKVIILKSARFGYTQMLLFTIGNYAYLDPSHVLVVQPTIGDCNNFSKLEIASMIEDNPQLADPLDGDVILRKIYPGGSLTLVGSNSPAGFRRITVRLVLIDECSAFGANTDGDAIELAIKRSETHFDRKIIIGSTPSLVDSCRITEEYNNSNQQEYQMPCFGCGVHHAFEWDQFVLDAEDAYHECPHCHVAQYNHHKYSMMEKGAWVAKNPSSLVAGYRVWSAYSEDYNASFNHIREAYFKAKTDEELLRVFTNVWLGQPYDADKGEQIEWQEFIENRKFSDIEPGFVPEEAKYLFAGVDVQGNRFEITIIAYLSQTQWHVVDHVTVDDIDPWDTDSWSHLSHVLNSKFYTASGEKFYHITRASVDSGYCTTNVYEFCRANRKRCIPIKGSSTIDRDIVTRPRRIDFGNKKSSMLYTIGTHKQKLDTFSQCANPDQSSFPALPPEYFQGLFSEKLVVKMKNGVSVEAFVKTVKLNEQFDCLNYALFAGATCNVSRLPFPT